MIMMINLYQGKTKQNIIIIWNILYFPKRRRFSVKKCAGCTQGISSKEMVMRARDHVYHIGCFACDRCKRILSTGEYFGMRTMRIYCKADYEVLLREEAQALKSSHGSSKGRPRKRRLAAAAAAAAAAGIDSASALSGKHRKHWWATRPAMVTVKRAKQLQC